MRSLGFVPVVRDDSKGSVDSVFTYPETKVAAYLSTLPDVIEHPVEVIDLIDPCVVQPAAEHTVVTSVPGTEAMTEISILQRGGADLQPTEQVADTPTAANPESPLPSSGVSDGEENATKRVPTKALELLEAADERRETRSLRKRRSPRESSATTATHESSDNGSDKSFGESASKRARRRSPPKQSRCSRKQR